MEAHNYINVLQSSDCRQVEETFNILVSFAEDRKHLSIVQDVIAFLEHYDPFDYPPAHPCPVRIRDLRIILKEIMQV